MEPPPDWRVPSFKQRIKVHPTEWDHHEWQNFSWWFNLQFLKIHSTTEKCPYPDLPGETRPTGLFPPLHIQTNLKWAQLVEDKNRTAKTDPATVKAAASLLPLACSKTPVSWSSAEGKKLAYYLPRALHHIGPSPAFKAKRLDLTELGRASIVALTNGHKPITHKKDAKRYGKEIVDMEAAQWKIYREDMEKKHGAWGRYIFGLWHATGQTHIDPGMCADEVKNAKRATAVQEWYPAFAPITQAIGRIFQEVDPWAYHVYRANFDHWASKWEFMKSHYVSSRCAFLSTAILVNQHVLPHKDGGDMEDGWVIMTVFGDFTEGLLCLPDLNTKVPFQPGDVIVFRSALLEHYVTQFKGQRYSCVFFTKETVVPKEGLELFKENPGVAEVSEERKETKNKRKRRARKARVRMAESKRLDKELDEYSSGLDVPPTGQ